MNPVEIVKIVNNEVIGSIYIEATIFIKTSDCPAESDNELKIVLEYTSLPNELPNESPNESPNELPNSMENGFERNSELLESVEIGFERNRTLQISLTHLQPNREYSYTVFVCRKNDSLVIGVECTGKFTTGKLQCMPFVNQLIVCKSHVGSWRIC